MDIETYLNAYSYASIDLMSEHFRGDTNRRARQKVSFRDRIIGTFDELDKIARNQAININILDGLLYEKEKLITNLKSTADRRLELLKLANEFIYHKDDCALRYNADYCDCGYKYFKDQVEKELEGGA